MGGRRGGFQSSPGPKAECYLAIADYADDHGRFQSSPGPKAECYTRRGPRRSPPRGSFNPHPARRPSATQLRRQLPVLLAHVSILTRPEGRVLRISRRVRVPGSTGPAVFQSSPGPKAECYGSLATSGAGCTGFNPHPARRPSATGEGDDLAPRPAVSILTRPEGRVLRPVAVRRYRPPDSFNPHPARRPSATAATPTSPSATPGFNPHPARRPSATRPRSRRRSAGGCFNPHPARRPSATCPRARC